MVLLRRMPVLDVYQQLWDGRTAWGIGAAAGHDPGQQQYLRGEIRVQRPLASGADLLLTPSVTDMRELDGSAKRARVTTAGLAVGRTVGGSQFRAVPSAFFGMTRAEGIDGSIVGSGRPYGPTLSGTVAFSVRVIWAPLRSR